MRDTVKLLEGRVADACDRLKRLRDDRRRLESELETLRRRLDRTREGGAADPAEDWSEERAEALRAVRAALGELQPEVRSGGGGNR